MTEYLLINETNRERILCVLERILYDTINDDIRDKINKLTNIIKKHVNSEPSNIIQLSVAKDKMYYKVFGKTSDSINGDLVCTVCDKYNKCVRLGNK